MDPKQEHVILQKYRELVNECQQLMQKIAELETDCHEHKLVEQTLQPLDPERRAYRLVGDVLVERTVKEVLPSVTTNRENVRRATHLYDKNNFSCCYNHTAPPI